MSNDHPFRPRVHVTPPQNWMNDPNGLVYHAGEYHLFYQHNPHGKDWGHMSWGHAVSPDLVHWTHLPLAIPEVPAAGYTIFSGSAVIDSENTGGFAGPDASPMVAVYTADHAEPEKVQTVHVAYSTDRGRTFTEHAHNPVIDRGRSKFGDPKVFWHAPTERWVMVNICGRPQGHIVLYGSRDLRAWDALSEFHAPRVAPGVWECPDLFPLAVAGDPAQIRWVLKTNYVLPGEGVSGTRYFVGDFDGTSFTDAVPTGAALTSDGGAIYAEVTYNGAPDGRRVLVGWLRQRPHPDRPWTGAQSVPRVLTLHAGPDGPELRQAPIAELRTLRGPGVTLASQELADAEVPLDLDVTGGALEVVARFDVGDAAAAGLRLRLADGTGADVGYDAAKGTLFIAPDEGERVDTPLRRSEGPVTLHALFDQEIVEVFAGEGRAGATGYLPFGVAYAELAAYGVGDDVRLRALDAWPLTC